MYNVVNLLKIAIKNNKKGFIIIKNKSNLKILEAFLKLNLIKFLQINNNYITVYINYNNNKPVFLNIINLLKNGHKRYINVKNLKKLSEKHNWTFIISTSKGLLNNKEALNNKIGGLLLVQMWN